MIRVPPLLKAGRRSVFAAICAAGVCEAIAIGIGAFAMRDIFYALHHAADLPVGALLQLALSALATAALRVSSRSLAERLGQSYAVTIRRRLYRHLAGQALSTVEKRRSGALGLRFVGDLSAVRNWAGKGLAHIITAGIVLPGAGLTLWLVNPVLARVAALPILLFGLVMIGMAVVLAPVHRQLRSKRARIAVSMMERVRVAPLLDRLRRTRREVKQLDRQGQELIELAVARARALLILRCLPEIGLSLAGVAMIWTAFKHEIAAADVAAALAVAAILSTPLRDLASVWDRFAAWRIAREKLALTLNSGIKLPTPSRADGGVEITFQSVRFRGLAADFTVFAGETVLVAGPHGSGKTSLLRLAAGLDVPEEGRIGFGEETKAPRVVTIGRDGPILQGSLRRALSLGAVSRPDDVTLATMAQTMGLGALIDRIGGLSGRLGEDGRTISEGESIRILLVRALITRPNIVIVDTPMVSVDEDLRNAVRRLKDNSDATLLIASHSGQNFDFVDRRFMILDQAVVETREASASLQRLSA